MESEKLEIIVMSESRKFAKLLFGNSFLFRIVLTIPMLTQLYFSFAYLVANISDMKKVTDATYICAAMCQLLLLYWTFASQILEFENLLTTFQITMNNSN